MTVNGSVADNASISINTVHQLIAGKNPSWFLRENAQQLKLHGRQIQLPALQGGDITLLIQLQNLIILPSTGTAAQNRFYSSYYFAGTERLQI